jgi:hypothetical protein
VTVEPYVDIPGKPAGSLNVTPGDLAKFALMLAGRGTYNGITLLKPESVQRIETPASSLASRLGLKEGYGLGNIAIVREKTVFHGHDGGIDSFLSIYIYDPVSLSGFIAMVNTANGEALDVMDTAIAYLERNRQKPAVVPYVARPGELAKFAGVYQSKSPRQQMLAPLEALADWAQVTVEGNALVLDGVKRIPVAPNVFQRVDRMAPSVVFAETDNGIELLTATGAKRKVAESEIYVKAGFGGAFGLSLAISVIYALVWIMGWVNGRLAERGGVLVRAVPALVVLALASLAGLLLFLLADEGFESIVRIGTPSPVAVTLYAISLSIPVLGGLSLVLGLIAGHGTSLFVRGLALLNGMIGLTASAFLWSYGWIGLKTWM